MALKEYIYHKPQSNRGYLTYIQLQKNCYVYRICKCNEEHMGMQGTYIYRWPTMIFPEKTSL